MVTKKKRKDDAAHLSSFIPDEDGFEEEIKESEESEITIPFNPTLIRMETKQQSLDTILTRIQHGEINLAPDFQRKSIWSDSAQSRLIESILVKIPLPAFYMDASDENNWLVVDGLQRLTALKRFVIDQELSLTGLEFLLDFIGRKFGMLPRNFQRRIVETQVVVYLIQYGTPPEVKFNVFKRINTGGMPLSAQEIRHALNQGVASNLLMELAKSNEFLRATDYGVSSKRMGDRECVLRYLAFSLFPPSDYSSRDFDGFLNEAMRTLNGMTKSEISDLGQGFRRAMTIASKCFQNKAFRKQYDPKHGRYPINKALFEAWSVNLSLLSETDANKLIRRRKHLVEGFYALMNEKDFEATISQGTGDIKKVRERFRLAGELIREVLQ